MRMAQLGKAKKVTDDFEEVEVQVVSRETKLKQEINSAVQNPEVARDIISKMRLVKHKQKFENGNA